MTEQEKKPCGLLHDCHELRKLILENPGLPLLIFAGEEIGRASCRERV